MKNRTITRVATLLALTIPLSGCTSFLMKQRLRKQLSVNGKFDVRIVEFNKEEKTARAIVIDKALHAGTTPPKIVCPYKYDGDKWIADPSAIFRPHKPKEKE